MKNNKLLTYSDHYFISCPTGLEPILENEIKKICQVKTQIERGGINIRTNFQKIIDIILQSRIASRAYKKLFSLSFIENSDIPSKASLFEWETIFSLNQNFKIHTVIDKQILKKKLRSFGNTLYFNQILKDAIVDRFNKIKNKRPSISKNSPDIEFLMWISKDHKSSHKYTANIMQDLTGSPIYQRGYRKHQGPAPLKENLAAGIIELTEWDTNNIFIDSMCGSCTIAIEAALKSGNIPAAYKKIIEYSERENFYPWSFLKSNLFTDNKTLQKNFSITIKNMKKQLIFDLKSINNKLIKIYAYDINSKTINLAKQNCNTAKLENSIIFKTLDACKSSPPTPSKGIIFANPPYGVRIGDFQNLEKLYYQWGENLKRNYTGWSAFIFSGNAELCKKIKLKANKKHILKNGNIECKLIRYDLY